MNYYPLNYDKINVQAGTYNPSPVKTYNNKTFAFWCRSLFQRACSTLIFELPDEWQGSVRDFFYYCLFKFGSVAVFEDDKLGKVFQPCNYAGLNFWYQPTTAVISNPQYTGNLEIGKECEIIKLSPDYIGIWDVVTYYAEKLSTLDNAINMSLINNKFAFFLAARNKAAGEALKKMLDKINRGEPAVIFDSKLINDQTDKDVPWQLWERKDLKSSYLTSDQLMDFQTILNNFDTEIGIPVLPYQKKERMVTSEAESKIIDSTSRSVVWFDTLTSSLTKVNAHYDLNISVSLRYKADDPEEGGEADGEL